MGLFDFFRKKPPAAAVPAPALEAEAPIEPAPPPGMSKELARLLRVGEAAGPGETEAVDTFERMRGTMEEARAVEELSRVAQMRKLPDRLLLTLGATLLDRGEAEGAQRVLSAASSSPALVLLADLAERKNDLATALALVERVLLRDLDHPGARERHRRWRASLGFDLQHKPIAAGATVVAREADAPFDLLREVGRGGAAAVYEAVDRELGRHVALKVYHQPERDKTQLAHEARVAVMLEGPAIVRVFDVDPDHGWIALEWAPAGALRDPIRGKDAGRLLPMDRWALPLATALARVHAAGWVHHDVKPANVILSRTNAAILTDFGSARRIGEPPPPGSFGFISPERMKGRPSDPRDDVYGYGRVLEEALAVIGQEHAPAIAPYRMLAAACTGPDEGRPADGRSILTRLKVELNLG
ncbi:MAG: serine/threonine protein kinase [Labilithrix sp.]|nr:serine/threonine protein kinase [Labilithrix sp.]MCW5815948.1 serine/threonine protein kinase [Labilithrix sp.]